MKKTAAVLVNPEQPRRYRIDLKLQEGKTARFEYSDRDMAREHFEQLRAVGVCGGLAIKTTEFTEYFK